MTNDFDKYKHEMEKWKAQEHRNLEIWKTNLLREGTIYQNINMQGQSAMKVALLINGGASVALLAFVGTTMGKVTENILMLTLCSSMRLFVFGTLSAALAFGVTYIAGLVDSNSDNEKKISKLKFWKHWIFYNILAVIAVISSYVYFIIGALNAYSAFVDQYKI